MRIRVPGSAVAFFFALTASVALPAAASAAAPGGSWSAGTPVPLHTYGQAVVPSGGLFYMIGGVFFTRESSGVLAYDPASGSWTAKAPMPTARNSPYAGLISSSIYVAGGWLGTSRTAALEVYDTVNDTWTTKASMPIAIGDGASAVYGGRLYALGGANAANTCVSSSYYYNVGGDSWTAIAAMPTARCHARAAVYGGKIYVMGGSTTGGAAYATLEVYDPSADSWVTATPMQTARVAPGAVASGGAIIVSGGYATDGSAIFSTESYDPAGDSWTYRTAGPTARQHFGFELGDDGRAYAFGGNVNVYGYATPVDAYDPAGDSWSTPAAYIPDPARDAALVALSTSAVLFGGQNAFGASAQVRAFAFASGKWTESLTAVNVEMPMRLFGQAATAAAGQAFLAGGLQTSTAPVANVWTYDWAAGSFTARAPLPAAGGCGAAGAIGGKIYVLLSCDGTAGGVKTLYAYDPAVNAWTAKASAPSVHRYPASAVINGKLYVAGGTDGAGSVSAALDVYDPGTDSWTTKAAMPTARTAPSGGALSGTYFVVAGGADGSGTKLATAEVYDSAADSWSALPAMSKARSDAASAVWGGNLQVVAGSASAGDTADAESFQLTIPPAPTLTSIAVSPSSAAPLIGGSQAFAATGFFSDGSTQAFAATGAWAYGPAMGRSRYMASAAYANGRFFVFGGSNNSTPSGSPTTEAFDPGAGTWASVASQPVNRLAAAVAAVGGTIYVAGGCVNSDCSFPTNALWAYDTSSNTWTQKASMPTTRFGLSAAVINGKVYVAGGDTVGYAASSVLEVYDPATNTWSTKAPLPGPRGFLSAASVNGKLYVMGGTDNASGQPFHPRAETFVYDPGANAWTAAASLPDARGLPGAAELGGLIYVVGGQTPAGTQSTTTYVYDPALDAWTAGPALNDQRYDPAVTAGAGRIFASGSITPNIDSTAWEFLTPGSGVTWSSDAPSVATVTAWGVATALGAGSAHIVASSGAVAGSALLTVNAPASLTSITVSPSTAALLIGASRTFSATGHFSDGSSRLFDGSGGWTYGPPMSRARYIASAGYANGRFYVFGGSNNSTPSGSPTTEAFDPAAGTWSAAASQPVNRLAAAVAAVGGTIYVAGGCVNSDCSFPTNALWAYDASSNTWTQKASMPTTRFGPAAAVVDGKVYVAGGDTLGYAASAVLEVYDPATNTWATKAPLPGPRGFLSLASFNGKLYAAGGTDNAQGQPFHPRAESYVYDPSSNTWTAAAPLPEARALAGAAAVDGRIYVMSGQTPGGAQSTTTYVYDPSLDAWSAGPLLNDQRYEPAVAAGGGRIFVSGSLSANLDSTSCELLTPGPGISWSSDAPSAATVTASGVATGLAAGTAHIVASSGAVTGSATLTVNAPASLTSITVSPSSAALIIGGARAFTATGHFSDGSARPLAGSGAWTRGPGTTLSRYLPSGAFAAGKFYAFGGSDTTNKQGTTTNEAYDPVSGTWTAIAPEPVRRLDGPAAAVNGIIYVIGGCLNSDCTTPTGANWAYDTAANTWTQKAGMPTVRYGMAVATVNGKVYVAGGDVPFFAASSVLEVYDPATDTWSTKASMPSPRGWGTASAYNGKLYVMGGTDNAQGQPFHPRAETFVYDPATDAWTTAAPMPEARGVVSGAALDGRIYVMGGQTPAATISSATFVYDPAADAWSAGPFLNEVRYLPAAGAGAGQVFVTGALSSDIDSNSFEILTPGPGVTWSSDAPSVATVAASGLATALAAGSAHVVASSGALTGSALLTVTAPAPPPSLTSITVAPSSAALLLGGSRLFAATGHFSDGTARPLAGTGAWTPGPGTTLSRYLPSGAFAAGKFYAFGGSDTTNKQGTTTNEAYDPVSATWTAVAPQPVRRLGGTATAVNGIIYVMGGCLNSDCTTPTGANWAYDTAANTWTQKAGMPTVRYGMEAATVDGKIYVAGGDVPFFAATAVLEVYDPATDTWSTKTSMPSPRGWGAASAYNGKLYVMGGTDNAQGQPFHPRAETFVYDPATDAWTTAAPMPEARGVVSGAALDGRIYVMGGQTPAATISSATFVYDPAADAWSAGPFLNEVRYLPAAGAGAGQVFVTGALSSDIDSSSFEILTPGPGVTWSSDAPSVATAAASGLATALAAGTAHVVASSGAITGSALVTVAGLGFSGSAPGTSSVTWSWPSVPGRDGFRVLTATGADASGILSTATLSWTESGLGVNAAATRRLEAFDATSSLYSLPVTVYTRAAPPSGTSATVLVSSAVLTWSLNGNPTGTLASIERSTNAAAFAAISSSTATSFTDQGLAQCVTYYYRVRNYNGDFLPTAYDATATVHTSAAVPLPPGSLTAQALAGGAIALTWSASPSSFLTSYRLYMSTGALSYAAAYAELPASATSFTTPALSTAAVYRFGLRAYSACAGSDDGNTNLVATATPLTVAAGVSAVIKVPESGKKVSGNRVTVMAELATGDARLVKDIRFQFRTAASTFSAWADIPAADVQHPNPAPTAPYFIHWDVTGLANGSYELRAVAELLDSTVDPAPASIVIGVDAVNHDTDETVIGGSQQKEETVYNGAQRTVGTADDASGAVIQVTLPAGVVTSSADTLTLLVNPPGAPPPDKTLEAAGQTLQITLGSGQTSLNGAASIVMHYADENEDGIVDGTSFRADRLAIYSYNVASGKWRKESNTVLDRNAHTLTATTPHFSLFGLFSPAAAGDLAGVRVFPVPWVPGDGDANNGKPFVAGDTTSGIVFDNLTEAVRIQVYSATGSLVWEFSTSSSGGRVQWDGRGSGGRDAASGGYLAVISDRGSGARVVRKIAIIR